MVHGFFWLPTSSTLLAVYLYNSVCVFWIFHCLLSLTFIKTNGRQKCWYKKCGLHKSNIVETKMKSVWMPRVVNQQDTHWVYASQLFAQLWIKDNKQEHIGNSRNKSKSLCKRHLWGHFSYLWLGPPPPTLIICKFII